MTGLPKPTIARITNTLVSLGYLKQLPNSTKYTLDIGVLSLGYAALSNISIRNIAHRYMEEMSQYVQAPVAMATRDRLNMVYIDVVQIENCFKYAPSHWLNPTYSQQFHGSSLFGGYT